MSAKGIADSGSSSKLDLFYESDESETPRVAATTDSFPLTQPRVSTQILPTQTKPVGSPKVVFTIRPSTPPASTIVSASPTTNLSSLISLSSTNVSNSSESSISPTIGGTSNRDTKNAFSVPEPTESVETPSKRRPTIKMTTAVRRNADSPTHQSIQPPVPAASNSEDYENSDDDEATTPKKRKRIIMESPSQLTNPENSRILSELVDQTLHLPVTEVKKVPGFPPEMLFSVLWYRLLFRDVSEDDRTNRMKFRPKGDPGLEPTSWESTIKQILYAQGDAKEPSSLTLWRVERQLTKFWSDILKRVDSVAKKHVTESLESGKSRVRPPCNLDWLAEALLPDVYAARVCEYVVRWVKKNRKKNFTSAETIDQPNEKEIDFADVEAAAELVEDNEKAAPEPTEDNVKAAPSDDDEELFLDDDENSMDTTGSQPTGTSDSQYMNDDGELEPEAVLTGAVEALASVSLMENRITNEEDDASIWRPSPELEARMQSLNPNVTAKQVEFDRLKRRHEMSLISDVLDEKSYAYFAKCSRASFARQKKKLASFLAEKCGSRNMCVRFTPEVLECLGVLGSEFIANLVRRARSYPDKKLADSIGGCIFCCWIPRYKEGDLLALNMNPADLLQ